MKAMIVAAALALAIAGCGTDAPVDGENYGNLFASPGVCAVTTALECAGDSDCPAGETCNGLVLVRAEHPAGWTRPDCSTCHESRNIHSVSRSGLSEEELEEVRVIVRNQGDASCPLCHGGNGVLP